MKNILVFVVFCFSFLGCENSEKDLEQVLPNADKSQSIPESGEYVSYKFSGKPSQGFVYNTTTEFWEWGYMAND
jgi:hypothetical protein